MLKTIRVSNFKSFKDLKMDFNNLNVLVGANGSGKSNFIKIFKFLRDIVNNGLYGAIKKQGGLKYFRNINIGNTEPTIFNFNFKTIRDFKINSQNIQLLNIDYVLEINNINDFEYGINTEKIVFNCILTESNEKVIFEIINDNGKFKAFLNENSKKDLFNIEDIFPKSLLRVYENKLSSEEVFSILETPIKELPFNWASIFTDNQFYDIDPKISKELYKVNGNDLLQENGENVSALIKDILDDEDKKMNFLNIVETFIPSIESIGTENYINNDYIFFNVKESFSNENFPSWYISDGTNILIAIIVALCFDKSDIGFIEEVDKNIHPKLISNLMDLVDEVTLNKQIFITTHNGEILKHTNIEDIYLISRNFEGYSQITRPFNNEAFKKFLKTEVGIDELFINDLLGNELWQ
ncbi:MAG: AAA family ATPase [Methanobrevibacter sp.]|jgi:predicted ATPase|nr:AAA family ATPase [Candidatus Methanoflexus mossambicus]